MGHYRYSRNIEASFIDFLKPLLQTDWGFDRAEKTFAEIYKIEIPSICIRVRDAIHSKVEVGSDATTREVPVLIDLFCENDGQKLDLKDYLIEKIKGGIPYYEYEIERGQVKNKVQNGRIRVLTIGETPIDFDTDKQNLDLHDRFKYLLNLTISLGRVEA